MPTEPRYYDPFVQDWVPLIEHPLPDPSRAESGDVLQVQSEGVGWATPPVPHHQDLAGLDRLDVHPTLRSEYLELLAETNLRLWQLEADVIGETEGFAGWTGEAFLTNQDNVASVAGDVSIARAARLGGGGLSIAASPILGLVPGDPLMGGFFVGVMDTTQGNIIAGDQYQSGLRYALIISPQSMEAAPGQRWYAPDNYDGDACKTRWDGLSAQRAALAEHGGDFEAFDYCAGLTVPSGDDASEWYLPALDEMGLVYRLLKPTTASNFTGTRPSGAFPGGDPHVYGENPSSDPVGAPYTAGDPAQTLAAAFQSGGAEAFVDPGDYYWTATWYSSSAAWFQRPDDGAEGNGIQDGANPRVRAVRRLPL